MNVIDQAFVKAYSRRSQPRSVDTTSDRGAATAAGTPDVSVHPQAAESAVIWIDAVADQYLRSDAAHPATPTAPLAADAPRAPLSPRGPLGNRTAAGAQSIAPSSPAATASTATAPSPAAPSPLRVDLSSLYHSVIASPSPQPLPHAHRAATSDPQPPSSSRPADATTAHAEATPAATFQPFTAAWEVDAFELSSTVTALFGSPELMKSIGDPLDRAVSEGLQTLLITSDRVGSGQTTVATGIALAAAAAGLRVALVDATGNSTSSSLADALNLDVQQGWLEAIRSGTAVAEVAVHSIEDQLTVIPKTSPRGAAAPEEFSRMIAALRRGFDLIVVDGPSCREPALGEFITAARCATARALSGDRCTESRPVDAVILVQDLRRTTSMSAHILDSLKRQGINGLGLVENFT